MNHHQAIRLVLPVLFSIALAAAPPPEVPPGGAVAAGFNHSLWMKPDGSVWAWGANESGQVGDGTFIRRTAPVPVVGLSGVTAIAAGSDWSMALRTDGTVWTWGANHYAFPISAVQASPRLFTGLSDVVSIAAAGAYAAALKSDGTVWWWAGSGYPLTDPPFYSAGSGMVAVAQGADHVVLLNKDGSVWTRGTNYSGQLGDGTTIQRDALIKVPGLTGITAVAAGSSHTVALKSDGTVWTWGAGSGGQAGDGTLNGPRLVPTMVPGLAGIQRIAARDYGTIAQSADGKVWEWGTYFYGDFGAGITRTAPVEQPLLAGALALAPGFVHTLALRSDGAPMAWGSNAQGQLGSITAIVQIWPEAVPSVSEVVSIAAGKVHSTIVKRDGTLLEWGRKKFDIGPTTLPMISTPQVVSGLSNVIASAEGTSHSYALKGDGTVWSWGYNLYGYGALGDGTPIERHVPQAIAGLSNIKSILSGDFFGVALSKSGSVWTWGRNDAGQLGDGTTTSRSNPTAVAGLSGVKAIAICGPNVLALRTDGTVWGWGQNGIGQLGDGTHTRRTTPAIIAGLTNVTAIAGSDETALALRSDGTVWSWGGDHGLGSSPTPAPLMGLSGVRAIWAGFQTRFAQTADGSIWAWGSNGYGGLGDGTTLDSWGAFVRVQNLPLTTVSLSSSAGNNMAVTASGQLWAWGYVPSSEWATVGGSTWLPQLVFNTGSYTLGSSDISTSAGAGSQSVALTTATPARPWVAARDSYWLNATPSSGSANSTLTVNWQPNPYPENRTGTIRVGDQTLTMTQAGSLKISGQILLNGTGVSGVAVNVTGSQSATQLTDATGRYEVPMLSSGGTYTVTPSGANLRFSPPNQAATNLAANQTMNFAALLNATGLTVNRPALRFAAALNGTRVTPPQQLTVTLTGTEPLLWTAASNKAWLAVTPGTGARSGKLTASLVSSALPLTGTDTALITITAPNLPNGTVTVSCALTIATSTSPPFGSFDTPGPVLTGLAGSVAVTGWALDDIGVQSVKIWRDRIGSEPTYPNGYVYIGDALFVPDARPDVEAGNPALPSSHIGGWGYLMLTNALPGVGGPMGNGAYRLHAIATDMEGNQTKLGTKTIALDNRNSTKPFGAVDAPAPGETIEGSAYLNNGWTLTPQPDIVPIDGSTLAVIIDGVVIGRPTYNQPRADVAGLFPGYANSAGPGGHSFIDTTAIANGMHTIAWVVFDDKGHGDGIGSRFFNVLNNGGTASAAGPTFDLAQMLRTVRISHRAASSVGYRTGYDADTPLLPLSQEGIRIAELERLELHLPSSPDGPNWSAALRVGDELRALPVGSTFDAEAGIFYWQLGPGFLGEYTLEFRAAQDAEPLHVRVQVGILSHE